MGRPRDLAQPFSLGGWLKKTPHLPLRHHVLGVPGGGDGRKAAGRAEKQKLGSAKAPLSLGSWKKPSLVFKADIEFHGSR